MRFIIVIALKYFLVCNFNIETVQSNDDCFLDIVETIPSNLTVEHSLKTIYSTWSDIISLSSQQIDLSSFYYTLTDNISEYPSSINGTQIFELLKSKASTGVKIQFIQNTKNSKFPDTDTSNLQMMYPNTVQVYNFDVSSFTTGIHHVKQIFGDSSFYLGSANMDWRALSEIVEVGLHGQRCTTLGQDLHKLFMIHRSISLSGSIPTDWSEYETTYNRNNSMIFDSNHGLMCVYVSSSPQVFNSPNRTHDYDSIVDVITSANKTLYLTAMTFSLYGSNKTKIWHGISKHLIDAVKRDVDVRIMVNKTKNHWIVKDLKFLEANGVKIKFLEIPRIEHQAPYSRLTHSKYLINEKMGLLTTSNFEQTYFTQTTGISVFFDARVNTCNGSEYVLNTLYSMFLKYWNYVPDIKNLTFK